jgi:hypothetical protein
MCRVAASPYPAYKSTDRRPGKRSATGHNRLPALTHRFEQADAGCH